ncbi:MAG: hypothetical protein ASARMPREDX12_008204 [Alectoria sarmentosa]|nr:MAG: hypothetical protein ASARMPREDX12_008204 [Alectoria sarmentosa]
MPPAAQACMMPNATFQSGALESVGPYVFAKVQESKGASGPIHEIEILVKSIVNPNISTSGDEDPYLVGACTLLIALETEKDSGRMIIDAKIETLYQDSGDHVLDIRMLATLLGYVQKYCRGRDIKHLSIITTAEHPIWLTNFFHLAGFSPCKCLKSDDLEKGQRICLKLDKSMLEPAKAVEGASQPNTNGTEENHAAGLKPAKPPSLTIKGTVPAKALDGEAAEAEKWLSQNQQILSPRSALAHPVLPKPDAVQTPTKLVKQSPKISNGMPSELPHTGEKRKRSEMFSRDHDADAADRSVRRREENALREPTKQEMREEEERLNLSLQRQREALQRATDKVSSKLAGSIPIASKPISQSKERPRKAGDMTDALLAQYSQQSPVTSSVSIKKEAPKEASPPNPNLTPAVRGGSPDPNFWRPNTLPAKSLTCFYWASQGYCLKDERDCLHAHYHTGEVARPPPSYKYKAHKNGFHGPPMGSDGAEEEYDPHHPGQGYKGKLGRPPGDVNHGKDQGMSIKGLDTGSKNVKEEKGAPTQPKVYQDMKLRPGDNPYDSYRPRH